MGLSKIRRYFWGLSCAAFFCFPLYAQTPNWLEGELKLQTTRLASPHIEERRDAVLRLGALLRPDAARLVLPALRDAAPIVRATAARAVLAAPPAEAAAALLPLLSDKDELVRQEAAYALGETRQTVAVQPLLATLATDKSTGVRGAAVISLGLIKDAAAVEPLVQILTRRVPAAGVYGKILRRKDLDNPFIRRAAAQSLGNIGSRTAVPALLEALQDAKAGDDVRREAAHALGLIGDAAAVPALRAVLTAGDPYLSRIAYEALLKIAPAEATRPG